MTLNSSSSSPEIEDAFAARVDGESWSSIPNDLYIPPEAFAILLEHFEGPLDFLLYLVQKNGFDLKNIDIAPIARQYLIYMEKMKSMDIELTADYMVMAALLADLKSRLLLPKINSAFIIEDDPKQQLIARLEQYLQVKQAAQRLASRPVLERDVFEVQVSLGERGFFDHAYDASLLHDAMLCIFHRPEPHIHTIGHEPVLLEERMDFIKTTLAKGGQFYFENLLQPAQGRMGMVVTFMAILELAKQQYIHIIHDGSQSPLCVQGKHYATSSFS